VTSFERVGLKLARRALDLRHCDSYGNVWWFMRDAKLWRWMFTLDGDLCCGIETATEVYKQSFEIQVWSWNAVAEVVEAREACSGVCLGRVETSNFPEPSPTSLKPLLPPHSTQRITQCQNTDVHLVFPVLQITNIMKNSVKTFKLIGIYFINLLSPKCTQSSFCAFSTIHSIISVFSLLSC
jgi:hypothetical protein